MSRFHSIRPIQLAPAALVAAAALVIPATAQGKGHEHRVALRSTMFAAQVGSLTDGGSVYAGSAVDRNLGHDAIVFTLRGTTRLRLTFQEYLPLGTVSGHGAVGLRSTVDGDEALAGRLAVTSGTGRYAGARGRLRANGTIDGSGQIVATIRGSFGAPPAAGARVAGTATSQAELTQPGGFGFDFPQPDPVGSPAEATQPGAFGFDAPMPNPVAYVRVGRCRLPAWERALTLRGISLDRRDGLGSFRPLGAGLGLSPTGRRAGWLRALRLRSEGLDRVHHLASFASSPVLCPRWVAGAIRA